MPKVCRLTVYPIKSLDGHDVDAAGVLVSGALADDRRWAIVDGRSRWINGKSTPEVHLIRTWYAESLRAVTLSGARLAAATFRLPEDAASIAEWLSDELGRRCRLIENAQGGFPDDTAAPGVTIVSTASLAAAASWFEGLDLDEMRRRIRANVEIDAQEPFWEDRLGDDGRAAPRFALGSALFRGRTICQRCIVPTRDARTGQATAGFARRLAAERMRTLPAWAPREQFDHFYRLALNAAADRVPAGAMIRRGDPVEIRS